MEVKEYKYSNKNYSFSILNLGCAVTSICVPDRDGKVQNITLPFIGAVEDPSVITNSNKYYGLTVGRFANRIGNARFSLNGKTYCFENNDGPNFLHSGNKGLWARIWSVKHMDDGFLCSIKVTEEEDGFPGEAEFRVRFSLSEDGIFKIHYTATCTEDCPVNITNHTYFNLTGDPSNTIEDHLLKLDSTRYLAVRDGLIPTGEIKPVKGTSLDFTTEKLIGKDIENPELAVAGGYDHAYVIDRLDGSDRGFIQFVHLYDKKSGRIMQGFTDLPAFHFYSGNFMDGECGYQRRCGLCLETEYYPDCVNQESFPSCIVKPGEFFESTTAFHFYTDNMVKG